MKGQMGHKIQHERPTISSRVRPKKPKSPANSFNNKPIQPMSRLIFEKITTVLVSVNIVICTYDLSVEHYVASFMLLSMATAFLVFMLVTKPKP
jgi:hypothetical protein